MNILLTLVISRNNIQVSVISLHTNVLLFICDCLFLVII